MIKRAIRQMLPLWVLDLVRGHGIQVIRGGVGAGLKLNTRRASGDYESGLNELPVQQALKEHLKPGDVFYDVGANIGFFGVLGARLVGTSGKVVAFEPVPQNAALIRENFALNGFAHARVVEKAVASHSGRVDLLLSRHPGGATLLTQAQITDAERTITVKQVSLDEVVFDQHVPAPSLIKIDVEGAELAVLRGMQRILREIRPLIVYEIDDETEEGMRAKAALCADHLAAAGYRITELPDSYPTLNWNVVHFLAVYSG